MNKISRTLVAAALVVTPGVALTSPATAGAATAASDGTPRTFIADSRHITAKTSDVTVGYDIKIHTANVNYAGTDGDVFLGVNGTGGRSMWFGYLDDSADNYERNRTDHFLRSGRYVGPLRSVTVCLNPRGGANAEWLPDRITVNGFVFPRYPNTSWFMKGHTTCKTFNA